MTLGSHGDGYMKTLFYKKVLNEYVSLTSTPQWYSQEAFDNPDNLLNWDCSSNYRYFSQPATYPYIKFEFKRYIPKISMYSMETHEDGAISHPLKWIVQGSNSENGPWELLDKRNTTDLKGFSKYKRYNLKESKYRYINFTQFNNYCVEERYQNTFAIKRIDFFLSFTHLAAKRVVLVHEFLVIIVFIET